MHTAMRAASLGLMSLLLGSTAWRSFPYGPVPHASAAHAAGRHTPGSVTYAVGTLYAPEQATLRARVVDHALEARCHYVGEGALKLYIQLGERADVYLMRTDTTVRLPLPYGDGAYVIYLYLDTGEENRFLEQRTIEVEGSSLENFLVPVYDVTWRSTDRCIQRAAALAKACDDDRAIAIRLYEELVGRLTYDDAKISRLAFGYVPSPEGTYAAKSGICYDMASLYAAMMRSQGVPTRICMGYAVGVSGYHAWNEIYIDGRWAVIDISTDVQLKRLKRGYSMEKPAEDYDATKYY